MTEAEGGVRLCVVTSVAADSSLLRAEATTQRNSMETIKELASDSVFIMKGDDQLILSASR